MARGSKRAGQGGAAGTQSWRWMTPGDARLAVRGLAWSGENGGGFARLPARAEGRVPDEVWRLAQCPAGARVAFRSDTTGLAVRVTNSDAGVMNHMAGAGSNGLSLYCGRPGGMRYWATARPSPESPSFESVLFQGVPKERREFRLYLPLYKPMLSLEIGVAKGARLLPPSPNALDKPVVFYGTSITQGGCASTAGSDFVSSVGRVLDLDVVNLGFSGSGRGEPVMAELVSEIDAALYVLDYAANADAATFHRNLPRFYRIIRKRRPKTPILLTTTVCFSGFDYSFERKATTERKRDVVFEFYARQRRRGDRDLHLVDGFGLIPFGTDAAYVDGVHPTDHGFQMMADRLAPQIQQILLRSV